MIVVRQFYYEIFLIKNTWLFYINIYNLHLINESQTTLNLLIMKLTSKQKFFAGIFLIVLALVMPTIYWVKQAPFNQNCGSYLENAAVATTPDKALENLNVAIDYIEAKGLTSGYTSILWKTEDENVEFWYQNLKDAQKKLEGCLNGSQMEKDYALMKLKETLIKQTDEGQKLVAPQGIHVYPNNKLFAIFNAISFLMLCFVIYLWMPKKKR